MNREKITLAQLEQFLFKSADILRGKGASMLRVTAKVNFGKVRGKEPQRLREDNPWFWSWDERTEAFTGGKDFDGARWNDLHFSLACKQIARENRKQQ